MQFYCITPRLLIGSGSTNLALLSPPLRSDVLNALAKAPKGVSGTVSNIFLFSFCCQQSSRPGRRPEIDSFGLALNFLAYKASGSKFALKASCFPVELLDSPSFLFN